MKPILKQLALLLSVLILLSGTALGERSCEQYSFTFDQLYFQFPGTKQPTTIPYALTLSLAQEDDEIFSGDLSLISGDQELLGVKVGYKDGTILAWANSGEVGLSHVLEIPLADVVAYLQSMTGNDASDGTQIDFPAPVNLFQSYYELLKTKDPDREKLYEDVFEQLAASGVIVLEMTDQPALEGGDAPAGSEIHLEINNYAAFMDALCAQDNTVAEFWNNYLDYIALLSGGKLDNDSFNSILTAMRMSMDVAMQEDAVGWTVTDIDVTVQFTEENEPLTQVHVKGNAREYCNPENTDDTQLELSLSCGTDDLSLLAMSIKAQQNTTDDVTNGNFSLVFSTSIIDALAYEPESISETEQIDDPEASKSADETVKLYDAAPEPDADPSVTSPEEISGSFSVDYTLVNDTETIAQLVVTIDSGEEDTFKAGLNVHADHRPIDSVPVMGFESANKINPFTAEESDCVTLLNSASALVYQVLDAIGLSGK